MEIDSTIIELGVRLGEASIKSTWSKVSDRIRQIKADKDKDSQIRSYDELVRNLMDEKANLQDIANEYREQLEKVTISDEDIESLHRTVENALTLIMKFNANSTTSTPESSESGDSLEAVLGLLNADTLKTLQLLGYNYKEAIGAPLTEATANFIKSTLTANKNFSNKQRRTR